MVNDFYGTVCYLLHWCTHSCFCLFLQKETNRMEASINRCINIFCFSQILAKSLHLYLLNINPDTSKFFENLYAYALYGGLSAGVFEETGRYVAFYYLLKKYREWKDGIAYGIGHGGLEAILIGAVAGIQSIMISTSINSGAFNQLINASGENPSPLLGIKEHLVNSSSYLFLIGGYERVVVFVIQLALSILVCYAVRQKKIAFFIYAILLHTIINFIALMAQGLNWNIFIPEGILLAIAILSLILLNKSKHLFPST